MGPSYSHVLSLPPVPDCVGGGRYQGHGPPQAHIPGDVRARYVVGVVSHLRGHVVGQIRTEESRLPGGRAELAIRHGGSNAGDQSTEKGTGKRSHPTISLLRYHRT